MEQRVFSCDITGYYIEFILKDKKAYMNTMNFDFKNIKIFMQLVRTSI
mgnify:CR=1 FL=1